MASYDHDGLAEPRQLNRHVISAVDHPTSQLAFAADTFRTALELGCYCVFLHDRTMPAAFAAAVTGGRGDLSRELSSGQLSMARAAEAYFAGGRFDSERMVGVVADAIAKGNRGSFSGFCGCGELTWITDGVVGAEHLLEYEYRLNELGSLGAATVMCIYDGRALPASVVKELRRVHPCEYANGAVEANRRFGLGPEMAASVGLLEELEPPLERTDCSMLHEIISAAADGELAPAREAALRDHMADCPECAETFAELGHLKRAIGRLRAPTEAPHGLWEAVRSHLH